MLVADISGFFDAVGQFFSSLADIRWIPLLIGLAFFGVYLTLRSRAYYNVLRAAYPGVPIDFRKIWGAYIAAYGFNNVVPARGGDVMKLFLVRTAVPGSTYAAIGASFFVELVFDASVGIPVLIFAFTQGVFPKPPDFASLHAFDLSFFASHLRFTLFLITALAVGALVAFALLSRRVVAFWGRVKQGIVILRDRRRYLRQVWLVQFAGWLCRCTAFWLLLEAFGIGGAGRHVLLLLRTDGVAPGVALSPRGAGGPPAVLFQVFSGGASGGPAAAVSG